MGDSNSDLIGLLGNLGNVDAGGCPAPFVGESIYPYKGGFRGGRNCAPNPLAQSANASRCCIPCPVFDWVYADDFKRLTDGAAWVNVAGFILCGILLVSNAVLPSTATRRSYLNIMLLISVMILELGFIVPLADKPIQCFDPVTPHGQGSSMVCAWSGAFVTFGLMFYVTWVLIRSLFMYLQVCWNITPGTRSYVAATGAAFSITIALTTATLAHSGVSFRFGGYCHVNVGSLATYWGWLFGFGGVALILQMATFIYCIKVYLSSVRHQRNDPSTKSPSIVSSSRVRTARATARRVNQVLLLQWRSIVIVCLAIFSVVFTAVIFIFYDDRITKAAFANTDSLIPWLVCLTQYQDKNQCLHLTSKVIVNEARAVAVLFILGFIGVEAFFLLFRWEIFGAWWDLVRKPFWKRGRRNSSQSDILMSPNRSKAAGRESLGLESPRGAETENKIVGARDDEVADLEPEDEKRHARVGSDV